MKKGFTLLELLAVIVVLAIVTLIAIPIIANVIEKSKEGSASDSAYGYIDTIEKSIALGALDPEKGISIPADNTLSMNDIDDAVILELIKLKGTKPDYVELTFERSKVKSGGFCIDGYNFEYKNKKIEKSNTNYCALASVKKIELLETNNPDIINDNGEYYLNLSPGTTYQLNPTIEATEDGITAQYKSNNESVATVSSSGLINALAIGSSKIIVHAGTKNVIVNIIVMKGSLVSSLMNKRYSTEVNTDSITIEGVTYDAHVYYYNGNQEWTTSTVPYSGVFGDDSDIGTSSTDATRMVVVKVDGNLTIDSDVTIKPYSSSYGGPKGFALIVTGVLINNGTIDNSHGAKAEGEKVYLWYNAEHTNEDDEYEFIPAVGGDKTGTVSSQANATGKNGIVGNESIIARGTGGGGSGSVYTQMLNNTSKSGAGGAGTSYSGGAGGGGAASSNAGNSTAGEGSSVGGAGGAAKSVMKYGQSQAAGGGAGNPGGKGQKDGSNNASFNGANGTGGLLIIYANRIINGLNGKITAAGAMGTGGYAVGNDCSRFAIGGSSGGGSINIFYRSEYINNNTSENNGISAAGGTAKKLCSWKGGTGGNGSITIGSIATGTFVKNL